MVAMGVAPTDQAAVSLLEVAQGPLLSSLAYSRAVEAVLSAAKRGIAGSEWQDATVRLLQSRSNSPLALLWAFLAFHRRSLNKDGASSDSLVSVAQALLRSLQFLTAGYCGGPTAIAAAAPIVQIVVSALANDAGLGQKKKWRKVLSELSGFITLCHHKEAPVTHGVFKAPSVTLGLDIWLSEESDFSSLFPFASRLKAGGSLNSIESVLHIGEIVETEVALLGLIAEILPNRASSSNKVELERKLKHNVTLYSNFLGSSGIILDMLLDAPLQLGGVLTVQEEVLLRNVLAEKAVVAVPNVETCDSVALSVGDTIGKDGVLFVKRVAIARQLAAEFRSRNEYLRASDLLAGLHRRGAPASLGEWLGERSSLRLVISTAVLQKPRALLDWLLNASNADFNVVLEKTHIELPKMKRLEDVGSLDFEEDQNPETSLFFVDTSKAHEKKNGEAGFDADQAYLMAVGDMQVATMDDVLFDRSEQLERKRSSRSTAAKRTAKQRKDSNGAKATLSTGEDNTDSEDTSTSEDESEMSE